MSKTCPCALLVQVINVTCVFLTGDRVPVLRVSMSHFTALRVPRSLGYSYMCRLIFHSVLLRLERSSFLLQFSITLLSSNAAFIPHASTTQCSAVNVLGAWLRTQSGLWLATHTFCAVSLPSTSPPIPEQTGKIPPHRLAPLPWLFHHPCCSCTSHPSRIEFTVMQSALDRHSLALPSLPYNRLSRYKGVSQVLEPWRYLYVGRMRRCLSSPVVSRATFVPSSHFPTSFAGELRLSRKLPCTPNSRGQSNSPRSNADAIPSSEWEPK